MKSLKELAKEICAAAHATTVDKIGDNDEGLTEVMSLLSSIIHEAKTDGQNSIVWNMTL